MNTSTNTPCSRDGRYITDPETGAQIHPAQLIGIKEFHARFPEKYPIETYAYASFDADAYARWGLPGLIFVALLYSGMRLSLAVVDPANSAASGAFYAAGIILLAGLPATASMQSILIAHGFPLLVLLALAINRRSIPGMLAGIRCLWSFPRPSKT